MNNGVEAEFLAFDFLQLYLLSAELGLQLLRGIHHRLSASLGQSTLFDQCTRLQPVQIVAMALVVYAPSIQPTVLITTHIPIRLSPCGDSSGVNNTPQAGLMIDLPVLGVVEVSVLVAQVELTQWHQRAKSDEHSISV